MDSFFDAAFSNPDPFLSLLIGSIGRAEQKWKDGLNIVDENGNPLPSDAEQITHDPFA